MQRFLLLYINIYGPPEDNFPYGIRFHQSRHKYQVLRAVTTDSPLGKRAAVSDSRGLLHEQVILSSSYVLFDANQRGPLVTGSIYLQP